MANTAQETAKIRTPDGIKPRPAHLTENVVAVRGYNYKHQHILSSTVDQVELNINFQTYERMENDPIVLKSKKSIVTNVLLDEMQFSPGTTEKEVDEAEYENYLEILAFSKRLMEGMQRPYREICEQGLGNGVRYGHGIGEIEWELRRDVPSVRPPKDKTDLPTQPPAVAKQGAFMSILSRLGMVSKPAVSAAVDPNKETNVAIKARREQPAMRLMIADIKIKPRGTVRFVVDAYNTLLGCIPVRPNYSTVKASEIIDRDKFWLLTLNQEDEDPRGKSFYRAVFNWYNLKTQLPGEMLRFMMEELVPKVIAKLSKDTQDFEYVVNELGEVVYKEDGVTPRTIPAVQSFRSQMENLRSGVGMIIPADAEVSALKSTASDAQMFAIITNIIDSQIENGILLYNSTRGDGEGQGRATSTSFKELLEAMSFMLRWKMAVTTITDLLRKAVLYNYGQEYIKYLPFVSFGDFVRRDWAGDLEIIAKAYFWGFIDDSQRAELCAWLNLPDPGESRAQMMAAQADINGNPVVPNEQRPDKQPANKDRNNGNSKEKKNNANTGRGTFDVLGHHGNRYVGPSGTIHTGGR